jgi:hypothetical protein
MSISSSPLARRGIVRGLSGAILFAALFLSASPARGVSPATLDLLAHTPDSAMVSIVVPAMGRVERRALKFAEGLAPELGAAALRDTFAASWSQSLGLPESNSLATLARSLGFDTDEAAALYLDFSPLQERAGRAAALASEPSPWWQKDASITAPAATGNDWVRAALVVQTHDMQSLEARVRTAASLLGMSLVQAESSVPGVPLHESPDLAYAFHQGRLYLANHPGFLREVLLQASSPKTVRYGSAACPEQQPDEIVVLTRLDKVWGLHPSPKDALLAQGKDMRKIATLFDVALMQPQDRFTSADPCVSTLAIDDTSITLTSRIDLAEHPVYAAQVGSLTPATLHARLPEGANALAEFHVNPQLRMALSEGLLGMVRASAPDGEPDPFTPMLDKVDALALGFYGLDTGAPAVGAVLQSGDAAGLEALLRALAPGQAMDSPLPALPVTFATLSDEADSTLCAAYWSEGAAIASDPDTLERVVRRALEPAASAQAPVQVFPGVQVSPDAGVRGIAHADASALRFLPEILRNLGMSIDDATAAQIGGVSGRLRAAQAGKVVEQGWQRLFVQVSLQ